MEQLRPSGSHQYYQAYEPRQTALYVGRCDELHTEYGLNVPLLHPLLNVASARHVCAFSEKPSAYPAASRLMQNFGLTLLNCADDFWRVDTVAYKRYISNFDGDGDGASGVAPACTIQKLRVSFRKISVSFVVPLTSAARRARIVNWGSRSEQISLHHDTPFSTAAMAQDGNLLQNIAA